MDTPTHSQIADFVSDVIGCTKKQFIYSYSRVTDRDISAITKPANHFCSCPYNDDYPHSCDVSAAVNIIDEVGTIALGLNTVIDELEEEKSVLVENNSKLLDVVVNMLSDEDISNIKSCIMMSRMSKLLCKKPKNFITSLSIEL